MDTRDRFIEVALKLFADKGFYGASMDGIAREVGLTKQALIHHFGTKEKLYGAVLARISAALLAVVPDPATVPEAQRGSAFLDAVRAIQRHTVAYEAETTLLMRELLDNRHRAASAGVWFLRSFLDRLHGLLRLLPGWHQATNAEVAAHVYQLLGAINYLAVSRNTLAGMYSTEHVTALEAAFERQLSARVMLTPLDVNSLE